MDYQDRAAPYLRMKMLGDDKSIRSSLMVKEVFGELNGNCLSKIIQEKCGAGHLRVDASSKSLGGPRRPQGGCLLTHGFE